MKDCHIRLELSRIDQSGLEDSRELVSSAPARAGSSTSIRAVGWNLAHRAAELAVAQGSLIDLAYRIRENPDPDYGGLEVEILGMEPAAAVQAVSAQ